MEFFKKVLMNAIEEEASDIHLRSSRYIFFRVHGVLKAQTQWGKLDEGLIKKIALSIMSKKQIKKFNDTKEVDLSFSMDQLGRFRVNIFSQKGIIFMAIRYIPSYVKNLDELKLPSVLKDFVQHTKGLILVTGATGSGKSTTSFALLNEINETQAKHIITIEDPVECVLEDNLSLVSQKEIGTDVFGFPQALRGCLRQDPDIIFVGEMRDKETIKTALEAAQTGHLVISTLHTLNSYESIMRILSTQDSEDEDQIRAQLSSVLVGIISQKLIPSKHAHYVVCTEVLVNNHRIKQLIQNKSEMKNILSTIEESASSNMHSFDQSLFELLSEGMISYKQALTYATRPTEFEMKAKGFNDGSTAMKDINQQFVVDDHTEDSFGLEQEDNATASSNFIKKMKLG